MAQERPNRHGVPISRGESKRRLSLRTHTVSEFPDGLPPDPATIAPAAAEGIVTLLSDATNFRYTGTNVIQTGVALGTIVPQQAAVVRGCHRSPV